MLPPSPILLVGTGSLACLFAARLAAANMPVTMLGSWPEGVAALRQNGVRLVEADGSERAYVVSVLPYSDKAIGRGKTRKNAEKIRVHERYSASNFSIGIVLVKSWQTERAARQLADLLAPDGVALTLQNGLGNAEILAAALGPDRVLQGVTTLGANLLEPGRVRAAGDGPITLGEHSQSAEIIARLQAAGFDVQLAPDVTALLWGKLVINAAINPLTALLRIANGELLERPTAHDLMLASAREAAAVAAALGIHLPYDDPAATVEAVARRTAANRSSMLQDVSRGALTEIDAISGAVVRAGEQAGVPTPVNRVLWGLVKALRPTEI
jgi:2-dehydropantoate 2-reductase